MPSEFIKIIKPANGVNLSSVVGGPVPQSQTYEISTAQQASGVITPIYDDRFPIQYPHVVKVGTQYFVDGRNILMSGDAGGGGGGGDADTLEGQAGSYYLNYANFTGNPSNLVNTGILSGTVAVRAPSGEFTNLRGGDASFSSTLTALTLYSQNTVRAGNASPFEHENRSKIFSNADGRHNLMNNGGDGYTRLTLGPEHVGSPAFKPSTIANGLGSGLHIRNGDDSAFISLEGLSFSGNVRVVAPSGQFALVSVDTSIALAPTAEIRWKTATKMVSAANGRVNFLTNNNAPINQITLGPETKVSPALIAVQSGLIVATGDGAFRTDLGVRTLAHSGNYTFQLNNGTPTTAQTIDWRNCNTQIVTLGGAVTMTFTAPEGPARLQLIVKQDNSGSRTVTWPATVKWPSVTAPTLTSSGNAVDMVAFWYDGTNYYGTSALAFG